MNLTETDKIYIAGFFDGEGCVGYYDATRTDTRRPGYFHASVHVCNVDPRVIVWIHKVTGMGRTNVMKFPGKKRRTAYQWQIGNKADVIVFLTAIRPFLKVKSEQVDVLLSHFEAEASYTKKHGSVTPEIVESRQHVAEKLKELKWMEFSESVETRQAESLIH